MARRPGGKSSIVSIGTLVLAMGALSGAAPAQTDPGVRAGAAGAGGDLLATIAAHSSTGSEANAVISNFICCRLPTNKTSSTFSARSKGCVPDRGVAFSAKREAA